MKQVSKYVPLTREQQALVWQWRGLAVKACKQIFGRYDEDAVAEGHLGLCYGARKFDPARGISFVTYGTWWARAWVLRALINWRSGDLKIGTTAAERKVFYGLGRTRRLLEALGIEATYATLARHLGVDEEVIQTVTLRLLPPIQIDHQQDAAMESDSHYAPVELSSQDPSPEENASAADDRSVRMQVRRAISGLPERERLIIRARFLDDKPQTLAELGQVLRLSRERVRQLEGRAIGRLRERLLSARRVA